MSDRPPVWVDGAMVPAEAATVGLQAHSLHYGTAVFDGGRFYRADDGRVAVFRLADHVRRLLVSARSLYMELAHDEDALIEASLAVAAASGRGEGYVRQLAFYGDEAIGIGASNPTRVAIAAWTPRGRSASRCGCGSPASATAAAGSPAPSMPASTGAPSSRSARRGRPAATTRSSSAPMGPWPKRQVRRSSR